MSDILFYHKLKQIHYNAVRLIRYGKYLVQINETSNTKDH